MVYYIGVGFFPAQETIGGIGTVEMSQMKTGSMSSEARSSYRKKANFSLSGEVVQKYKSGEPLRVQEVKQAECE